jgi:hypothetical protein
MSAESELKLIVSAVDKSTATLAKLQGEMDDLGKSISDLDKKAKATAGGGLKGIQAALASNNVHIKEAKKGMKELGVGVVAVGAALVKMTMDTKAYNLEMGDLAKVWNTSAEEASAMVQVADDVRISQEQMATAMKFAMKNGVEPSIVGLKEAAAKYQSFTDTQERAAWASKTFGKAWTEVARLLEMSPDQIDASVDAAKRFGLVVGEKDVKAAQDLHNNLDTLGDAWTGLQRIIGNGIIPIVVKVTSKMGEEVDMSFRMEAAQKGLKRAYDNGQISMRQRLVLVNNMRWSDEDIIAVEGTLIELQDNYNQTMLEAHGTIPVVIKDLERVSTAEDDAAAAAEIAAAAQKALNEQMDLLSLAVSGPIQSEIDSYQGKLDDLNGKYADTVAKIDELKAKRWPTKADKEDIAGLESDLITIADDIKKTGDAHDEATKRILYNITLQRAGIDGFTEDENKLLMDMALNWGLIDTATYNYAIAADRELAALAGGQGIKETESHLINIGMLTSGIAGTYDIVFNVSTSGSFPVAPSQAQVQSGNQWGPSSRSTTTSNTSSNWTSSAGYNPYKHARGADYIVPMGYSNERWNVGTASSGERVTITPKNITNNNNTTQFDYNKMARVLRDVLLKVM